jgi:hypothetical protein
MSRDELLIAVAKLRDEHGEAFKRWYDSAAYQDVEHYCEIGYLVENFFEGSSAI